jgi:hypothetical protein
LEAKGVSLDQVYPHEVRALCEAYFQAHRTECIKVASDTVRIAAGLYQLAEKEARQRGPTLPSLTVGDVLTLTKGSDYDIVGSKH